MGRGRRGALDRSSILEAALEIVDRDGFEALTMRSIADALGVVPMATYRHFANKGALIDALLDQATETIPLPRSGRPWRETATDVARAVRAAALAHPGLVRVLVSRPWLGPAAIRLAESLYASMRDAGFEDREVERAANLVFGYALGFVALEVPRLRPEATKDETLFLAQDHLAGTYATIDPAAIPNALAIGPTPGEFVSGDQFEWGLATILDGIYTRW